MANDINAATNCVNLSGKDDIMFDCKGYAINGSDTGTSIQHLLDNKPGSDNVTIRNCANITKFAYGIYLRYSDNATIQNVTIWNNTRGTAYGST